MSHPAHSRLPRRCRPIDGDARWPLPYAEIRRVVVGGYPSLLRRLERLGVDTEDALSSVLEGLGRRRGFDPARGMHPAKYVSMVARSVLTNLLASATCQSRGGGQVEHLGVAVLDEGVLDVVDAAAWAADHAAAGPDYELEDYAEAAADLALRAGQRLGLGERDMLAVVDLLLGASLPMLASCHGMTVEQAKTLRERVGQALDRHGEHAGAGGEAVRVPVPV